MAAERFEDRLRQMARQARHAATLQGLATETSGVQPLFADDADRLADLVAAARKLVVGGVLPVHGVVPARYTNLVVALAALDEAGRA